MPDFVRGLELARRFYWEAVRPILGEAIPGLPHSAALLGPGSEVLGYDTEMSTDHSWGPRVLLFVEERRLAECRSDVSRTLGERLPREFLGYPVAFLEPGARAERPLSHRVEFHEPQEWFTARLGCSPAGALSVRHWLSIPQQRLLELTAGEVFHDDLGIQEVRDSLAWYPRDIWLYLLAASWARIAQEEHLMPRAGYVGDEIGSALIGARLVREAMRLCFLLERTYAPYAKWLGTAFLRLRGAAALTPALGAALAAREWQEREAHLCWAFSQLARMQNDLGVCATVDPEPRRFHDRPFRVLGAERLVRALLEAIEEPQVRRIAEGPLVGSVDQWSDSTDLLEATEWRGRIEGLYP